MLTKKTDIVRTREEVSRQFQLVGKYFPNGRPDIRQLKDNQVGIYKNSDGIYFLVVRVGSKLLEAAFRIAN